MRVLNTIEAPRGCRDGEQSGRRPTEFFRNAVTQAQWAQAVTPVREPLGDVVKRELKSAQYSTTLPGAPDGEYILVQFTTTFEHKSSAVETVTSMKDADGAWRVAGYFVR